MDVNRYGNGVVAISRLLIARDGANPLPPTASCALDVADAVYEEEQPLSIRAISRLTGLSPRSVQDALREGLRKTRDKAA